MVGAGCEVTVQPVESLSSRIKAQPWRISSTLGSVLSAALRRGEEPEVHLIKIMGRLEVGSPSRLYPGNIASMMGVTGPSLMSVTEAIHRSGSPCIS